MIVAEISTMSADGVMMKKNYSYLTNEDPIKTEKSNTKVLLVFGKNDSQCQAIHNVCDSVGFSCDNARSLEAAVEAFSLEHHQLVIIDKRSTKYFDGDVLCKQIRENVNSKYTVILAITRRRYKPYHSSTVKLPCFLNCDLHKRNQHEELSSVQDLLNIGFNRVITETSQLEELHDELLQIENGELQHVAMLRSHEAIFKALERTSDAIQITDNNHWIQYVNHAYENLTDYTSEQVLGKNLSEFIQNETNEEDVWDSIREDISNGKEWEGLCYTKRRADEDIQQYVSIYPVLNTDGSVLQYVLLNRMRGPSFTKTALETRRNSGPLERRLSVASSTDGDTIPHRRTNSLAKIHSMTIQAPITQIINLIGVIKEGSHHHSVNEALDQILEILRNSELYSPADLPGKSLYDPMVSDFVEGLVTGPGFSHRRSSGSDSMLSKSKTETIINHIQMLNKIIKKEKTSKNKYLPTTVKSSYQIAHTDFEIPPNILSSLEGHEKWDYDILKLERVTSKKPLVYLGNRLLREFGACEVLRCSESTLRSWLHCIECNYHANNPYHNSTHAADVLHATAYFLKKTRVKEWMEPADNIASLIAAIIHDVDHPGYTNAFLINSRHPLALLYNDTAVLESHHAAFAFKMTVSEDSHCNIFKNMPRDNFMAMRQSIIDMVLATELSKHFEHVNKFISIVTKTNNTSPGTENSTQTEIHLDPNRSGQSMSGNNPGLHNEMRVLIKRVMIKVADVSNPARPRALCVEWARRISEEYFNQTDEEKRKGYPVVMPHFDRTLCRLPKSQITFNDYFLTDMFDAWHEFCNISSIMQYLEDNYNYWRHLLDQGVMTLEELDNLEINHEQNMNHVDSAAQNLSRTSSNYLSSSSNITPSKVYADSNKNLTKTNERNPKHSL